MDKKAMMMIMVLLAVLSCLGVSLWYYFSPSEDDEESTEKESSEEEKNDSLLDKRPAFTLNVINGDNETTETVTPSGDETVDVTVDGDTATTTGATTEEDPTILMCEEGQTMSNGECVPTITPPPAAATPPPAAATPPPAAATPLVCEEGFVNSNGVCTQLKPEYRFVTREQTNIRKAKAIIKNIPHHRSTLQEVKDECVSVPKCNHVVSLNNEKVYFLIEGDGQFYPNEPNFTTYTKTAN
jgi:hypothetical protein